MIAEQQSDLFEKTEISMFSTPKLSIASEVQAPTLHWEKSVDEINLSEGKSST